MKVLLIISSIGFQETEFFVPKTFLESQGVEVKVASDKSGMAQAKDGSEVAVDMTLEEVKPKEVDGVFFIGGSGALEHLDNQESNRILNEAMLLNKPYGAICISPRILARANVFTGKKATGWNGDGELEKIFSQNNVEYVREPVVVDGNVITADGPSSAEAFARAIAQVI